MLGSFLQFFVHHIENVIELLFVFIALFTLFLLYRSFKKDKEDVDFDVNAAQGLEEILQKELATEDEFLGIAVNTSSPTAPAQATQSAATTTSFVAPSADQAAAVKEKEQMIAQLNEKLKMLEASSKNQTPDNSKDYEKKITELKEKLAEYEIIEDDIANLSFYKTENTRLKDELARLGVKSPAGPAPKLEQTPGSQLAVMQTQGIDTTKIVVSGGGGINKIETNASVTTMGSPPAPEKENVIAFPKSQVVEPPADIMKEFEAAVKQKNDLETAASKVLSTKKLSQLTVAEDDEPAPPPPKIQANENDLLKEFSDAIGAKPAPTPAPTSTQAPGFVAESANSEKLLSEISKMGTEPAPPKKPLTEEDESKKLINEFEEFVKKSTK